ncbi:unnamed protein product [Nyctereutes procyonoides]|uniref:(raccoon dog) hypothetical protein n=1 Tax=Nyctereutes procyonoides TaxID=34880 RepID=A0A811Z4X7_NYCPR|nr:unnamed protein product [Nyctereutes procyonoides]
MLSGSDWGVGREGNCLLGCSHPNRPQREGLPCRLKVLPVNSSSSVHVPRIAERAWNLWVFWTNGH